MGFQYRAGILFAGVAALLLLGAAGVALAQEAVVKVESPGELGADGRELAVVVVVEDVSNLGGFEFTLGFNPDVLEYKSVVGGDFLGSSGRQVQCLDPKVQESSVSLVCVTLGPTPAEGANGTGQLARVSFSARGEGESALTLTDVQLVVPPGDPIASSTQDGSVQVLAGGGGIAWGLWGPVIAIGGLVLVVLVVLVVARVVRGGRARVPAA